MGCRGFCEHPDRDQWARPKVGSGRLRDGRQGRSGSGDFWSLTAQDRSQEVSEFVFALERVPQRKMQVHLVVAATSHAMLRQVARFYQVTDDGTESPRDGTLGIASTRARYRMSAPR